MSPKTRPDEPLALAVKLDSTSNGEYWPKPLSPELVAVRERVFARSIETARKMSLSRRDYLTSTCGAAAVFLALNELGCRGGRYDTPKESAHDPAVARGALGGEEFIFDVQTHHVSTTRKWWETNEPNLSQFLTTTPQANCGAPHWAECFSEDVYLREIFMASDTQLAVLSALWGDPNPIEVEEGAKTQERVAMLEGKRRLRLHGGVYPNEGPFEKISERMQEMVEKYKVDAWKLYPVWGPERVGYWLDGDLAQKTISRGIELGRPIFAIHKGLPLPGQDPQYAMPKDVGKMARMFPKATFLIYHSGFESDRKEGPYDPSSEHGVDALISSLKKEGLDKNGNVYAELGSTWREAMKDPDQAAHVLGKLLLHLGEDRILWGTDGIWYGSPQDQIQAFRIFEITEEFREKFGYPALTKEVKAKIFGLNAARVYGVDPGEVRLEQQGDAVSRARAEYEGAPVPVPRTYGPRTRREMIGLLRRGR